MNIARSLFESKGYPERFPEFRRLMAYCDTQGLSMSFHDDPGYLGIRAHWSDGRPIDSDPGYTMYLDTQYMKIFTMGNEDPEIGMRELEERIDSLASENDDDLMLTLGMNVEV
jgi:hypothetical protein